MHERYVSVIFTIDVKIFDVTVRTWWPSTRRLGSLWLAAVVAFLVYSAVVAGTARAGAGDPSDAVAAAVDAAQRAATEQAAASTASGTQQQPANNVALTRTESPGDDAIAQANAAAAVADGSNDGSTSQTGAADPATDQSSSTDQNAGATAVATQNQPTNIVVIVRINSPGDDWISQSNSSVAAGTATNTSVTKQGTQPVGGGALSSGQNGTGAEAGNGAQTSGAADTSGRDATTPIGPPAQQEAAPPPSSSPNERRSTLVPLPAPAPPTRSAAASTRPARDVPAVRRLHPSTAARAEGGAGMARVRPSATSPSALTGAQRHPAAPAARPARAQAERSVRNSSGGHSSRGFRERAADALNSLAPRAPVRDADAASSTDVSSAVLITLLAILAAGLAYAGSAYLPSPWRRLLHPRSRRRG